MINYHLRLCVSTLFFIIIIILIINSCFVLAADPPKPTWQTSGCSSGFSLCANVTTKETWASDARNIYFSVDALTPSGNFADTNVSVWYLGENYQSNWGENLRSDKYNVVRFSPRGSELAYPSISCNSEFYNNQNGCMPNVSCAEEISKSGLNMEYYSIAETANDLAWVLKNLGAGTQNIIIAEGFGTFIVHHMLKTHGKIENVSVIMAGFTHPEYFDIFQSINGYDGALQKLLEYCEKANGLQCITRLGAHEGVWNRFVNVMRAAELNTLKCNNRLEWGIKSTEIYKAYRAIVAALLKTPHNFLMPSRPIVSEIIPSFIYRLQRCEDQDVWALTRLYNFINSPPGERCPAFIPQRYNWLVNEFIQQTPPLTPEALLQETSNIRFTIPNISQIQSFYNVYKAYPKYNATNKGITNTGTKMLLLLSDVDPIFTFGLAATVATTYQADIRILPHQSGFPVTTTAAECIRKNLDVFRLKNTWGVESQCTMRKEDAMTFISFNAVEFYGVTDAWDFTKPNSPENITNSTPTPTPTPCPDNNNNNKSCSNKSVGVLAVFFVLVTLALAGVSYLYWKKSNTVKFSDDFYSNLNR